MRWRDTRFEKPTEADSDPVHQEVLVIDKQGRKRSTYWDHACDIERFHYWAPFSECDYPVCERVPDPPEGWKFVNTKIDPVDDRAKRWDANNMGWVSRALVGQAYSKVEIYIVPIDPPKPMYRPFANASEFLPHIGKMVVVKGGNEYYLITVAGETRVWFCPHSTNTVTYPVLLADYVFHDGTPCGVELTE